MMPVRASKRSNLSGWIAYRRPPGQRVVWDGGVHRQVRSQDTAVEVPMTDAWKNQLPNIPLSGYLDGEEFVVDSLPALQRVVDSPVLDDFVEETEALPAYAESYYGAALLQEPCRFVAARLLPEDRAEAFRQFMQMGPALARYPWSAWTDLTNPYFLKNYCQSAASGVLVTSAVSRNVMHEPEVERYSILVNGYGVLDVPPLYEGDRNLDSLQTETEMLVYLDGRRIVGYEVQ